MSHRLTVLAASSVLVAGVAFAALAQQTQNAPSPPPRGDQGMMMNRNMPMMDMSQQMNRMMENCNRMMESHMQQQPAPAPQSPEKKS
jgi:hypothetical protein